MKKWANAICAFGILVSACESDPGTQNLLSGDQTDSGEVMADTSASGDVLDSGGVSDASTWIEFTDPYEGKIEGAVPFFSYNSEDFFTFPFPTDLRRTADGVDWSGFPNPFSVELLDTYIQDAQTKTRGFSANGAIYFRFDRPLSAATLPIVDTSVSAESSLWLIDVDPQSPTYGKRHPVEWRMHADEPAAYLPSNVLMFRPIPGMPLREGGTYAAIVRRRALDADGGYVVTPPQLRAIMGLDSPTDVNEGMKKVYEPLVNLIESGQLNPFEVGVATVFTVDRFTDDLVAIRKQIASLPVPEIGGWKFLSETDDFAVYEGTYKAPNYQSGTKPYTDSGGAILLDTSGLPVIGEMETIRFALTVPKKSLPVGWKGWPLVLHGHGTGGDYLSFVDKSSLSPAKLLANRNMAVLSIDQPLHGIRYDGPGDVNLLSFNYLNPDAGRSNFRQSAIDFFTLARMAKSGITVPGAVTVTGAKVSIDSDRVTYFGHSHGGLAGVLIGAVEPDLKGIVLSGAGAGLAQTLILRKNPVDILALLELVLQTEPDEVDEMHPIVTLVQNLVDITDPINYAPYVVSGELRGGTPIDLLVTEGLLDEYTPPITTESLAAAAGLDVVAPVLVESDGMRMAGVNELPAPIAGNAQTVTGALVTAALYQENGYGHFLIYDSSKAAKRYADFLLTIIANDLGVVD
ncbi:MAG: hypothetical protein HUU55_19550 [Myxococcales bacterium]|nr:hypothetical protein [Myxococcales bacterium]